MNIREVTQYIVNGETFPTYDKAKERESDLIGEFVEKTLLHGITFSPRQRLRLHQNIMQNRRQLTLLLAEED